ncbi:diguanylate cyclase [Myxococcota bacterium]|nr:diguanylate cyclase [Myxococcota bacterium]MBU1433154.1 diguanylate cyclase [Myxococcota bacterium]MBU1899321.1 diguanylate cyclase [Myxococcota bacterium]
MLSTKAEIEATPSLKAPHGEATFEAWRALTAMSARLRWPSGLDATRAFDALTGVLNRAGFERVVAAQREATRAPRSLLALQLDDDHGLERAIAYITHRVQCSLYEQDLIARVSPAELAILLHDVRLNSAVRVAQRLCDEVRHRTSRGVWGLAPRTVSLGVTEILNGEPLSGALRRAAIALNNAKQRGGDRVGACRA